MAPRAFLLFAAASTVAASLTAQQLPIKNCGAAVSCSQPYGYQAIRNESGEGGAFFGVRARFGRGLSLGIVHPRTIRDPVSSDAVERAARLFVARHPLRPRRPSPPQDAPAAPAEPDR